MPPISVLFPPAVVCYCLLLMLTTVFANSMMLITARITSHRIASPHITSHTRPKVPLATLQDWMANNPTVEVGTLGKGKIFDITEGLNTADMLLAIGAAFA